MSSQRSRGAQPPKVFPAVRVSDAKGGVPVPNSLGTERRWSPERNAHHQRWWGRPKNKKKIEAFSIYERIR